MSLESSTENEPDEKMLSPSNVDQGDAFADSFPNGPESPNLNSSFEYGNADDTLDAHFTNLMNYPGNEDYYSLLGLSRNQTPTDGQIRSAYRTLTLSFHPDKQPPHLREAAEEQFEKIREAYETLIDQKKRTVYDLLGVDGVRREWNASGVMGMAGVEKKEIGVRAMNPAEFRRWFLKTMKARERQAVNSLVEAKVCSSLQSTFETLSLLRSFPSCVISLSCP
jgi:hypothetical protein